MASTMVTTDKLYQEFMPTERLTILLEAMAREDWTEAIRIRQTCPKRTYSQGDLAFEGPRESIWDLSIIVAGDVRVWIGRMRMLEMFGEVCPYITSPHALAADMSFVAGWRLGKELSPQPDPPEAFGQEEGDYVTEQ